MLEPDRSPPRNPPGRALVVPPAGWGNMGDLAMMTGTLCTLRQMGFARVDLALSPPEPPSAVPFDAFVGGGEWFYGGDPATRDRLHDLLNDYSDFYLIGADCIDGSYSPGSITRRIAFVAEAIKRGARGRILGSSCKETLKPQCLDALRAFPLGGSIAARDPISQEHMEKAIGRTIRRTADLAFLCPSDPDHAVAKPVLEWISEQRSLDRRIVAISINAATCRADSGFAPAHAPMMKALIDSGVSLVLVPHDTRGREVDEHFLRIAISALPDEATNSIVWLPAVDATATKAVLGAVDFLVSSRMHPVILAAGGGCGALSYVYQGKFEGLYRLLGLDRDGLVFHPGDLMNDASRMSSIVLDRVGLSKQFSGKIHERLPGIIDLAMANFRDESVGPDGLDAVAGSRTTA